MANSSLNAFLLFLICGNYSLVIQKKLQETEHALADLEERYRQANTIIKEKEYLISNLLKSGKIHLLQFPSTNTSSTILL